MIDHLQTELEKMHSLSKRKYENKDEFASFCPYCREDFERPCPEPEEIKAFCEKCRACINNTITEPLKGDKRTRECRSFNVLKEEEFFMALTFLTAQYSKDCEIAACLVSKSKNVIGITGPYHSISKDEDVKFDFCEELNIILSKEELDSNCCIYFNVYPHEDIRMILDNYKNLEVTYMPDNGQIEAFGKYKPFKPANFSKIKIQPHESDHLTEEDRLSPENLPGQISKHKLNEINDCLVNKYFFCVCFLIGMRSEDPSKQVGACIVNENNQIVGIGFNHPRNQNELFDWKRPQKISKVVFAEEDAVDNNTQKDLSKCRIYSTIFPGDRPDGTGSVDTICKEGIKLVIYTPTGRLTQPIDYEDASMKKFSKNNVEVRPYMNHFGNLMCEINYYFYIKAK